MSHSSDRIAQKSKSKVNPTLKDKAEAKYKDDFENIQDHMDTDKVHSIYDVIKVETYQSSTLMKSTRNRKHVGHYKT